MEYLLLGLKSLASQRPIPYSHTIGDKNMRVRKYKVKWNTGVVEDNVLIADGAWSTWEDVEEVLIEYPEDETSET